MADFFIYTGLVIMVLGSLYGIYIGIEGFRSRPRQSVLAGFSFGSVSPRLRRLIALWGAIMAAGLVLTCIGMSME